MPTPQDKADSVISAITETVQSVYRTGLPVGVAIAGQIRRIEPVPGTSPTLSAASAGDMFVVSAGGALTISDVTITGLSVGRAVSVQGGSSLELSNVELSQEFINLITYSTGYSASSRVLTTADRLVQELLAAVR